MVGAAGALQGYVPQERVQEFVDHKSLYVGGCDKRGRSLSVLLLRNHVRT